MRALAQSELLQLWESGRALHPLDRGLLALYAAAPDTHGDAADWPIGRRNRALAELRTACFGPRLRGWTDCPHCREQLDFELDARAAAIRLIERCRLDGTAAPADQTSLAWIGADVDALGEQMALADPLAEMTVHFDCPQCGTPFDESLDLAAFVWAEIEGQAKRLLLEVHTLAAAYGWSETDILSLAPARREFYLAMVRA
jgi:hypothetical protein